MVNLPGTCLARNPVFLCATSEQIKAINNLNQQVHVLFEVACHLSFLQRPLPRPISQIEETLLRTALQTKFFFLDHGQKGDRTIFPAVAR
ncbi:MAG: hypothetical protein D3903_12085 [Candidatus Electrothrix sp. GM3_4]|nr:hypothetical protein [Candidatus Electrothrix sp. GM3_4]